MGKQRGGSFSFRHSRSPELKEGDQIEIRAAGRREFEIACDRSVEKALERIRQLRRPLPRAASSLTVGKRMRGGKAFFETNVLIYAFAKDDRRTEAAETLLAAGRVVG